MLRKIANRVSVLRELLLQWKARDPCPRNSPRLSGHQGCTQREKASWYAQPGSGYTNKEHKTWESEGLGFAWFGYF